MKLIFSIMPMIYLWDTFCFLGEVTDGLSWVKCFIVFSSFWIFWYQTVQNCGSVATRNFSMLSNRMLRIPTKQLWGILNYVTRISNVSKPDTGGWKVRWYSPLKITFHNTVRIWHSKQGRCRLLIESEVFEKFQTFKSDERWLVYHSRLPLC